MGIMGGNTTSHVANATNEVIYCRCQDNPTQIDFEVGLNTKVIQAAIRDKTPFIPAGFVALAPRDVLDFPSSHPFLSMKTTSGRIIADNYNPGTDVSVIITPEFTLQKANYGSLWVGRNGQTY